MIYADANTIIDTDLLISAEKGNMDGGGPLDGQFAIRCLLALGQEWRESVYIYKSEEERDAAFMQIGQNAKEGDMMYEEEDEDEDETYEYTECNYDDEDDPIPYTLNDPNENPEEFV